MAAWRNSMPKLADLLSQKANLEKQIATMQREERAAAIAQVKSLMAEHGLTPADLSTRRKKSAGAKPKGGSGKKVPAKYRNKATGETWSGRGLQPRWLKAALAGGKQKLADFAV
jgi:DNA-binding protein H-NS